MAGDWEQMKWEAAATEYNNALAASLASNVLRPRLFIDGNKWCALYGENLQDGVAGFGDSPSEAYADFDNAWTKKLPARPAVRKAESR